MVGKVLRAGFIVVFTALVFSASAGCGGNGIPETVTVELPDGTQTQVTLGSGVLSLADSSWQFFATSGASQGLAFVTINFGPKGDLAAFENNTFASDIFGSTLLFDGARHNTNQPGLSYAAATFGAETSDATGFTFEARLTGFAAGIQVATATATASGSFDPDNPDVMTGTFSFAADVSIPGIPTDDLDQEFSFSAQRVVTE